MSDTTGLRVLEVFDAARQLHGEERTRYLDEACGADEALRAEVLSLLPHADSGKSPVDAGPAVLDRGALRELVDDAGASGTVALAASDGMPESVPEVMGPFRIVRRIATGGMGTVYEAEQADPERRVALKTIRTELLTPALLKRFRREAGILGRLQHPGIAQVFEAGTVEHGGLTQPYFAMEYVDGRPIDTFATAERLDEHARLLLFAQVCDAVQHAHEQGVVHRDLKPDNILVTPDGHPKVLDFGVARLTTADAQATTLVTEVGQVMGTLAYMSPEQVAGRPDEVDARSDVYSLGVLLFELLCGRRPHDIAGRSLPDVARMLQEEDATSLGSVATRWRGDLDTIVGKALEKDADRRYAGADELAADVRRHLEDQPIAARAPSRLYRARKFARRHRGLVVGAALAAVALLVGMIVSLRFAFDEAQQRRVAEAVGYRALITGAMASLDDDEPLVARGLLEQAPEELRGWEWHHALARTEPLLWELENPPWPLSTIKSLLPLPAFGTHGELLAAALAEDRVGLFEAETGVLRRTLQLSDGSGLRALVATAQGFLSATHEGHLVHWDAATGEPLASDRVQGPIGAMAWDETTGRLAVANDVVEGDVPRLYVGRLGALAKIDPELFARPGTSQINGDHLMTHYPVHWCREGQTLIARGGAVVDVPSGATAPTPSRRSTLPFKMIFAGHGERLVAAPNSGFADQLMLIDAQGTLIAPLDRQLLFLTRRVSFSHDGEWLVATCTDGLSDLVTLHDVATGRASARWPGDLGTTASLSGNGEQLALWTPERTRILALATPATTVLPGGDNYVYNLAWTPDGRTLLARGLFKTTRAYDAVEGSVLFDRRRSGHQEAEHLARVIRSWGISADGRWLVESQHDVAGDPTMGLATHDLAAGGPWRKVPGVSWNMPYTGSYEDVDALPRSAQLAFLNTAGLIGPSEVGPAALAVARAGVSRPRLCVDPSGELLVSPLARSIEHLDGSAPTPLLIDGEPLGERHAMRLWEHCDARFSPDGRLLAAARTTVHEGVVVHDVSSGDSVVRLLADLPGKALTYAVAFSPDGSRLAVGGTERVVSLFDTSDWELLTRLEGHRSYVKDLAWSPDGATLASAGGDGTVRLWHTRPQAERMVLARDAAALREARRPSVVALFEQLDDPQAAADAVCADASLDDDERHASLRVVRELADAWWAARGHAPDER